MCENPWYYLNHPWSYIRDDYERNDRLMAILCAQGFLTEVADPGSYKLNEQPIYYIEYKLTNATQETTMVNSQCELRPVSDKVRFHATSPFSLLALLQWGTLTKTDNENEQEFTLPGLYTYPTIDGLDQYSVCCRFHFDADLAKFRIQPPPPESPGDASDLVEWYAKAAKYLECCDNARMPCCAFSVKCLSYNGVGYKAKPMEHIFHETGDVFMSHLIYVPKTPFASKDLFIQDFYVDLNRLEEVDRYAHEVFVPMRAWNRINKYSTCEAVVEELYFPTQPFDLRAQVSYARRKQLLHA